MTNGAIFTNLAARKAFDSYMERIRKKLERLPREMAEELIMEYESHIFEATRGCSEADQPARLAKTLEKLGIPEEFLTPVVAQKALQHAARTFNPMAVLRAICLNLRNGAVFIVFGLLYLFLAAFVALIPAKLFAPGHTGLFTDQLGFRGFGCILHPEGATEILGAWFIPVVLTLAVIFYFLITLLLRITRK